jgi:hypothetical protein
MKIRLLKKWRQWSVGTTLEVFDGTAKKIITEGIAYKYTGEYPPQQKMKTNLFNPMKENGKS